MQLQRNRDYSADNANRGGLKMESKEMKWVRKVRDDGSQLFSTMSTEQRREFLKKVIESHKKRTGSDATLRPAGKKAVKS